MEISSLKTELILKKQEIETLTERVRYLEFEITRLEKDKKDLEASKNAAIDRIRSELKQAQDERAQAQHERSLVEVQLRRLQAEFQSRCQPPDVSDRTIIQDKPFDEYLKYKKPS